MSWWSSLTEGERLAVIAAIGVVGGGTVSGIVSAIIAYMGFKLTLQTSTAANREIANVTRDLKSLELNKLSRMKIADARIDWVERFRSETAELYACHHAIQGKRLELKSANEEQAKAVVLEQLRNLYTQRQKFRAQILMRLNPNTSHEDEIRLEKLLRRSVNVDGEDSIQLRSEIRELTRSILNREWNKAKSEIND